MSQTREDLTLSALSDEKLGELRAEIEGLIDAYWSIAWQEGAEDRNFDTPDGRAQATRSAITDRLSRLHAAEAGWRVKPLEWDSINPASMWAPVKSFWMCYRISLRADRMKQLRLEWLGNRNDDLGIFDDWDAAKAAAQLDFDAKAASISSAILPGGEGPTHRHKKRGTEYVLIGYGKMQAEDWHEIDVAYDADSNRVNEIKGQSVDMREVAIYRSATDPTEIWVRPREEFEDGRFEAIPAPSHHTVGEE